MLINDNSISRIEFCNFIYYFVYIICIGQLIMFFSKFGGLSFNITYQLALYINWKIFIYN